MRVHFLSNWCTYRRRRSLIERNIRIRLQSDIHERTMLYASRISTRFAILCQLVLCVLFSCLPNCVCLDSTDTAVSATSVSSDSRLMSAIRDRSKEQYCERIVIKSKRDWKAAMPVSTLFTGYSTSVITHPVRRVTIHRTNTIPCDEQNLCIKVIQVIQRIHIKIKNMRDIGFNFIIGGDRNVYETRGWHIPDDLLTSGQSESISIAFVGQFNEKPPSKEMLDAASNLIKCGQQSGFIAQNFELHYEQDSPCAPNSGDALYNSLKKWPQFTNSSPTTRKHC